MKLLNMIQQRLGWKLFLSYLVIILVVVVVLDTTSELRAATLLKQAFAQLPAPLRDDPALNVSLNGRNRELLPSGAGSRPGECHVG